MPTRTTLQKVLNRIIIHPGIQDVIFNAVAKLATKLKKDKKDCVLLFDEMAISPHLQYNCSRGLIEGYEDYGYYRTNHIADHVQVGAFLYFIIFCVLKQIWNRNFLWQYVTIITLHLHEHEVYE